MQPQFRMQTLELPSQHISKKFTAWANNFSAQQNPHLTKKFAMCWVTWMASSECGIIDKPHSKAFFWKQ
jgi:hypothetical protein